MRTHKMTKVIAIATATLMATSVYAAGDSMDQSNTKLVTANSAGAVNTNGDFRRDKVDPNNALKNRNSADRTMDRRNARTSIPAETTTLTEHTPTKVKEVQRALDSRGFEVGSVDGIWGSQTRSALKKFQSSNGLRATGELNDETYNALGVSAEQSMDEMYSE